MTFTFAEVIELLDRVQSTDEQAEVVEGVLRWSADTWTRSA